MIRVHCQLKQGNRRMSAANRSGVAERARLYAQLYVGLTEALQQQGVPEPLARGEASMAATTWLLNGKEGALGDAVEETPCPVCGRP